MAQVKDRKSSFYGNKQSVVEDSCAPQHLESAGDIFIKDLARKQLLTSTTLKEQLEVVQNFEKGIYLNPDSQKGIVSLEEFKRNTTEDNSVKKSFQSEKYQSLDELKKTTGLSRHELELTLVEKPNSATSKLFKFAIANKKREENSDRLEDKLPDHPINHLKELEEECFGHLKKKKKLKSKVPVENFVGDVNKSQKTTSSKKKRHRKRKKKNVSGEPNKPNKILSDPIPEESIPEKRGGSVLPSRPSLWDVKDMKTWSESKKYGCKEQTFYTIRDGKIIKLEKINNSEGVT